MTVASLGAGIGLAAILIGAFFEAADLVVYHVYSAFAPYAFLFGVAAIIGGIWIDRTFAKPGH